MAVYEALLLNTVVPQIQAAQAGDSYVMVVNATTPALRITQTGTGDSILVEDAANPDSSPFVVTAAGDVGIGTNAPGYKLEVNGGASDAMSLFNSTNANGAHLRFAASGTVKSFIGGAPGFLGSGTADDLGIRAVGSVLFATNGSSVDMTLDSSGNLGLGVTPSASGALGYTKPIQLGDTGAIIAGFTSAYTAQPRVVVGANSYFDDSADTWEYIQASSQVASQYRQYNGIHSWHYAAAGTAGNPISFTQAMTLDSTNLTLLSRSMNTIRWDDGTGAPNGTINASISSDASPALIFSTRSGGSSPTERARITSGGDLLVGDTTNPDSRRLRVYGIAEFDGNAVSLINYKSSGTKIGSSGQGNYVVSGGPADGFGIQSQTALVFGSGGTAERARITSGGYFKASDNGNYSGSTAAYHEFYQTANSTALLVRATNGSYTNDVLTINGDRNTTNSTYNLINAYNGLISGQFIVRDSGNVVNTNNSYGSISDARKKTDIVDAGSQWSDIKAMRFRKFKMKDDPSGLVQLGVVAQEVELTSPGLVDEHQDRDAEGNDLGTTTKSVKTSVLLMKAAVALQEAMARIETLEAEVAALKGA